METVDDAFDSFHPDTSCSLWVVAGLGHMIFPDSIVNARVRIRVNVIINRGPVVGHDCVVEDYAHVGLASGWPAYPGGRLLLGIGRGRQGLILGSGAVVVQEVGPKAAVMILPVRPLPAGNLGAKMLKAEP